MIPRSALAVLACCACAMPALAQGGPDPAAADASYGAARTQQFRLTPQMIEDLANRYEGNERARARVGAPSTFVSPEARRIDVKFTPGDALPIIEAAQTYPTVLSFFDSSGQPWPVVRQGNSNPHADNNGGFEVTRPIEDGNTVEITVTAPYPRGGLVVYLRGAPKPLTFMLVSGRGRYDANASVFVAARGPNAALPVVVRQGQVPDTGKREMGEMLDGITPAGARRLTIVGGSPDIYRAWRLGNLVYLLTPLPVQAPEPVDLKMAEGGLRLYVVPAGPNGDTSFLMLDGLQNFRLRAREQ